MKKILLFTLLTALGSCHGYNPAIITGKEGQPIPSFNVLLMDSITKLNTRDIPRGKSLVVFYFNPYCPYCRAQTEEMIKAAPALKNTTIYLLSNFPFALVKSYYDHYNLKGTSNFTVVQDPGAYFGNYYKATAVPYTAVYDGDKRLKHVLLGKVSVNDIEKAIAQ